MPSVPKPKKQKKRKKRRSTLDKKYVCIECQKELYNKTMADKRKILDHLCGHIIYKRDGGRCQITQVQRDLQVHHIFGKKAYPAGRWVLDNLILLSKGSHRVAHDRPEGFRRLVIPWLCKRTNTPVNQAEEIYDWLFAHVQEIKQFRAKDFEEEKSKLEAMLRED